MATPETISAPIDRASYGARVDCANAAAFEIELVCSMLQKYIENSDDAGTIYPVTRGAFMRIASLTAAICSALADDGPTMPNRIEEARACVYGKDCRKEAAHG